MPGRCPRSRDGDRTALAVVLSLALAVSLVAGCGGDGDDSAPAGNVEAAATTQETTTSAAPDGGPSEKVETTDRPVDEAAGNGDRPGERGDHGENRNRNRKQADREPPAPSECPGGIAAADCAALADALGADTASDTPDDACPTGLSKSDCRALSKIIKSGGHSAEPGDSQAGCPPSFTSRECKQAKALLGG